MNKRFSSFALNLALAATLTASLLACSKHGEVAAIPVVEDGLLTSNVKAALASDPELKGLIFQVAAHAGVVELGGTFDSYPKIDRALAVTRGVIGVKSIDDKTVKKEDPAAPAAK